MSEDGPQAPDAPAGSPSTARSALAIAALALFGVGIFSRTLFSGYVPRFYDVRALYHPWMVWFSRRSGAADWLDWCHELGCGFPLWANGQSGAFHPITLSYLLPVDTGWMLLFITFLHILAAALGMFVLARRLRLGRLASVTGAIIFGFSGFTLAHYPHYVFALAIPWMPWGAIAMLAWVRSRAWWGLVVTTIGIATATMCHPQMALFVVAFSLAMLWVAPDETDDRSEGVASRLTRPALAVVPLVFAALISAIQIVPMLRLVAAAAGRVHGGYDLMTGYSFPPQNLVTLLLPYFFGTGSSEYWGAENFQEMCGYIGAVALLLAILIRPHALNLRRFRGRLWIVAGAALILALGGHTPLYDLLQHVPLLNRFRAPARWLSVWSAAGALLAAIAIQTLLNGRWNHLWRRKLAVVLVATAALCAITALAMVALPELNSKALHAAVEAAGLYERNNPDPGYLAARLARFEEKQLRGAIPADLARLGLSLAVTAAVLLLSASGRITNRMTAVAVAAIMLWQVAYFAWTVYDLSPDDSVLSWHDEVVAEIERERTDGRVVRFFDSVANGRRLTENLNIVHDIPIVGIYDAVTPPVQKLIDRLKERVIAPHNAAALGAEIVLTDLPPEEIPEGLELLRLVTVEPNEPPVGIYRNTRFEGLAWTCHEMPGALRAPPSAASQPRPVHVLEWEAQRIRLHIPSGPRCALVLALANLPEWPATINGQPEPIVSASEVFMGFELPSEACTVELRYHPAGFATGARICAVGLLLTAILATVAYRRLHSVSSRNR